MNVASIPALREDIEVNHRPDGQVDVRDPRLFNLYTLDASYLDIARHFDGERDSQAVSEALADEEGLSSDPAEIEQVAQELDTLYLLDTATSAEAEPSVDNMAPYALVEATSRKLRVLPEVATQANWSCRMCGSCCHGLAVELSEAEEARIDGDLYDDVLDGEEFVVDAIIDPEQPAKRILRQRVENNRACIFLSGEGQCLVHERQGSQAKPDACQIFPYMVVHLPKGKPRMTMRTNCYSMHESWEDGEPAEEAIPEVRRLLETHEALKVPKVVPMFGRDKEWEHVQKVFDRVSNHFMANGVTPESLDEADRKYLRGRLAKSREKFGKSLLSYLEEEKKAAIPVEEGSLREYFDLLPRPKTPLEAMKKGELPPEPSQEVAHFLARQTQLVLHGFGPLNVPDAGMGLTMLLLALEACLHAVGRRGKPQRANIAFMAYTAPLLEVQTHAWPILEAIDPRFTRGLRESYIEELGY
ncbi:MAG: YkgJ family cysteine cluster protein [Myxococcales bacterium]|nr:YkgJ family cysteine cluster protein [Myxococcales bacterium]